jgi:hypothetical protein
MRMACNPISLILIHTGSMDRFIYTWLGLFSAALRREWVGSLNVLVRFGGCIGQEEGILRLLRSC